MGARIVFVGDDFTGASDSLATYTRGGLRTRMLMSPEAGTTGLDVLGLPTDLRSLPPERARTEVARLWPRIAAEAPEVLHLKVCSTFDSAPNIGSIGAVALALAERFAPDVVAVIGGQPSLGRYCVFGNLFARGPDGAVHRIDRHPVMSRHPVTPMGEADLALHLGRQGLEGLSKLGHAELADTAACVARFRAGPVLCDAVSETDLGQIGAALRAAGGRQLLIGASSVAEILGGEATSTPPVPAPPQQSSGLLLFAGSRSAVTQAQVGAARAYRKLPLTPEALASAEPVETAARLLKDGVPVLAHLLPELDYGLSPDALADRSCAFIAAVLARAEIGYLGLAGGDTSSRICSGLGFDTLDYECALGAGVSVCRAGHPDPRRDRMRILLKGGQMGAEDLFDRFAEFAGAGIAAS